MRQGRPRPWQQEGLGVWPVSLVAPLPSRLGCTLTFPLPHPHSKRTVNNVPTFDFCGDIVAGVADPISDETGAGGEPKKKRAPRKKKDTAAAAAAKEEDDEDDEKPVKGDDEDYED